MSRSYGRWALWASRPNYYKVLEVDPDCEIGDLKTAYKKKALETHPDKNGNTVEATQAFQLLVEAYTTLCNTRRAYDDFIEYMLDAREKEADTGCDEELFAQYKGYNDISSKTEAEWSEEYRRAFEEFDEKRERWEAEFQERKKESEIRPMQSQKDILEELDAEWPMIGNCTKAHAAQIIEMMNRLFQIHKQNKLNKLLSTIARANQGRQELFDMEMMRFADQCSLLPVYAKYGKVFLCSTRSPPPRDYADVAEKNEHRKHEKAKMEARQRPKPRLLYVTKRVQELRAERESRELSLAKSYIKARVAYQTLDEVKFALKASQQKQLEWRGEQDIIERSKYNENFERQCQAEEERGLWKELLKESQKHCHMLEAVPMRKRKAKKLKLVVDSW